MEEEGNNQIAFLDVLMDRMDTTNTLASLFRKKMHTDHYLDFGSHHHHRVNRGIVKCLKGRAEKVCHVTKCLSEHNHLHQVHSQWVPTPLVEITSCSKEPQQHHRGRKTTTEATVSALHSRDY